MLKFQKGDKVIVTAGKDKGRSAEVGDIKEEKVVLAGINLYKRHIKAALAADKKGGIYEIPRPLAFAKIALICPHCKKTTRVGFRFDGETKVRFCKKCDRAINLETKKKGKKKK